MIVEINDILINTDSICTAKPCRKTEYYSSYIEYCLELNFTNGKRELLVFKNEADRDTGYHTLRLFETVINKNKKR